MNFTDGDKAMPKIKYLKMFGMKHVYKVPDDEAVETSDWFGLFRQMLLDCHDHTPDYNLVGAAMHITLPDNFASDYGQILEMDLATTDVEALRAGEGELIFIWTEDFYDFIQKKDQESKQKEGHHER